MCEASVSWFADHSNRQSDQKAIYRVKIACKSVKEPGSFALFIFTQLVSFVLVGMIVVHFNTMASTFRLEEYLN